MRFIDTDHLSLWQRGHPEVVAKLQQMPPEDVAVCVISVEEQINGRFAQIRKLQTDHDVATAYQYLTQTLTILKAVPIVTYSEAAIKRYEQLKAQKLNVNANDLRIAAYCS